jgi:hypothetical protein
MPSSSWLSLESRVAWLMESDTSTNFRSDGPSNTTPRITSSSTRPSSVPSTAKKILHGPWPQNSSSKSRDKEVLARTTKTSFANSRTALPPWVPSRPTAISEISDCLRHGVLSLNKYRLCCLSERPNLSHPPLAENRCFLIQQKDYIEMFQSWQKPIGMV